MLRITLLSFSLLLVSMVSGVDVLAQTTTEQKSQECLSLSNGGNATFAAGDWQQHIRLSKRYIQTCKSVRDSESIAHAHVNLATAYSELGNQSSALSATETCIDLFYATPACHVYRVGFLLKLKRLQEAHAALTIAEKLVDYLTPIAEKDLQETTDSYQSDLNTAKRESKILKLKMLRFLKGEMDWQRQQINQ